MPVAASIDFSIVIPAYMESAHIADTLDRLAAFLSTRDYGEVEVVVVVAESPDGTARIAQSRAHLFRHFILVEPGLRVGKGRDVRAGVLASHGRYRLFMDADLATPLDHLDDAWRALGNGAPVVIAVRDLWRIHEGFLRKCVSQFGNWMAQLVLLPGIKDSQCGFKGFEASAAVAIFERMTMTGWSFDAEVLKIARLLGYQIATFEAPDWTDPKDANMGLVGDSPLHAAVKTLQDLFVIRARALRGVYRQPTSRGR